MKGQLRQILVAMDSSQYALTAAEWGAHLAAAASAELVLAHVVEIRFLQGPLFVDLSGMSGAGPYEHVYENFRNALHERGRNILAAGHGVCEDRGVEAKTEIVQGVFSECIEELSQEANLLILGRRGDNFEHGLHLMGSDGERAVRQVDCSCLIVPREYTPPRRVVIGVEDSGPARSAARWAEYFHEVFPGLEMQPLHICDSPATDAFAATRVAGQPVECREGEPEEELIKACSEDAERTLCVIGATGHTRTLKEFILGTLSFHVLHKLSGPVLLAR
jgi:nucleotide-binding universal stress UspA family protein